MLGSGLLLEYPYESDIPPERMRVLEAKELWDPYCQPLLRLPKEILLLFGPDVDGVVPGAEFTYDGSHTLPERCGNGVRMRAIVNRKSQES